MSPRLRLLAASTALAVAGSLLLAGTPARAATCVASAPSSGAFTVTVCLAAPGAGSTLTGEVGVSATVQVSSTRTVKNVQFFLGNGYVLTDYSGPYTFVLPSFRWDNGDYVLKARAQLVVGASLWMSAPVGIPVTISNAGPPPTEPAFAPHVPSVPAGRPLVVAAVGDGASGRDTEKRVVDRIATWAPDMFLYLGDVYGKGTYAEFRNWYGFSSLFGRFRSITNPVPGNHEYERDPTAAPYRDYWGAPPPSYSYDAGGWHFVQLNSTEEFGQVTPGTPQYDWLREDLWGAGACVLVTFHHPAWDLGGQESSGTRLRPLWRLLADEGVDLVVTGHSHNYMRWKPMDGDGTPSAGGTTEVVVGTGGHFLYAFRKTDPRVVSSYDSRYGALKLSLLPGSGQLRFIAPGGVVLDQASVACSPKVDHEAPSAPTLTAVADGPDAADLSWTASTDDVGVSAYRVERDGSEVATLDGFTLLFHDAGLVADTPYGYRVVALDGAGHESPSNTVWVTTDAAPDLTPPTTPPALAAEATGSTSISLTWGPSDDEVGVVAYDIERGGVPIATVASPGYVDTDLAPGTPYAYEVVARDAAGNASDPATASATTLDTGG